jgi:hypothetical protein
MTSKYIYKKQIENYKKELKNIEDKINYFETLRLPAYYVTDLLIDLVKKEIKHLKEAKSTTEHFIKCNVDSLNKLNKK